MLKEVATNLSHCCSTLKYRASEEIFIWLLVAKRLRLPKDMHFLMAAYILRVNSGECSTREARILRMALHGKRCTKCEYTQCYWHRGSGQILHCKGCQRYVCKDKCYKGDVCAHPIESVILCGDCDLCMECRIDADPML